MKSEIKREMITRAELIRGLANVLIEDGRYICTDARDFDLISLSESVREAKETIQKLVDNVTELEYSLYLLNKNSR